MTQRPELNINIGRVRTWVGIAAALALVVMEIVIGVQYVPDINVALAYGSYVLFCLLLDTFVALNFFVIKSLRIKYITNSIQLLALLAISALTANAFCVALYCLATTEFYMSNEKLSRNFIVFGVSSGVFVAAYVIGWVHVHAGESTYNAIVEILGGCLFGVLILIIHFFITYGLMRFYRTSKRLSVALGEADESKAALEKAYEELSRTAVFEERNRIAKDIHDNAGHSITSVIMQTEAAKLLIESDPEEAKKRIISANIQAKNALDQMRSSVHLLAGRQASSSIKDDIEEIVAQTADSTDLKIRCDVQDMPLDEERSRFLCNSVKECITNGIRHGGANAFYIELKQREGKIRLLVSDNGNGGGGTIKEGYGLRSMREKAEQFGGTIVVSGEAYEGCEVMVIISANAQN